MLYLFQTLATKPTSPAPLILSPSHSRRNGHHHYYRRHRYRYRQMLILSLTMLTPPTHLLHYLLTFTNFIFESKLSSSPSSSSSSPLASSSSLSSPPPQPCWSPVPSSPRGRRNTPAGVRPRLAPTAATSGRRTVHTSDRSDHCTDHTYPITAQITHIWSLYRSYRPR